MNKLESILRRLDEQAEQNEVEGINTVESIVRDAGITDQEFMQFVHDRCHDLADKRLDPLTMRVALYIEAFTIGLVAGRRRDG